MSTKLQNRLVISLTTIPPRMHLIGPTLRDLANQSAEIAEIRLHIPRTYKRYTVTRASLPAFPDGITPVLVDHDYGPATKILHSVQDLREQNTEILFCDDDQPYDPGWAQRFVSKRRERPDDAIAEKGYHLWTRPPGNEYHIRSSFEPRAMLRHKGPGYRLRRLATLLQWKPPPYVKDGYVDIFEGYRGVLVRPEFFPSEVFDIPDILWTVDDPWLSGHLTRNGHGIWQMADCPPWGEPYQAHFSDRLGKYIYKDHDRLAADTACIEYFRKNHGIWQDRDA